MRRLYDWRPTTSSPVILHRASGVETIGVMDEIEREDVLAIVESLTRLHGKAERITWLLGGDDGEEAEEADA